MNTIKTIHVNHGEACDIKTQTQGMRITGPATVVVIKSEEATKVIENPAINISVSPQTSIDSVIEKITNELEKAVSQTKGIY